MIPARLSARATATIDTSSGWVNWSKLRPTTSSGFHPSAVRADGLTHSMIPWRVSTTTSPVFSASSRKRVSLLARASVVRRWCRPYSRSRARSTSSASARPSNALTSRE